MSGPWSERAHAVIYVVDDNEAVRNGLKLLLEVNGFCAAAFASGSDLLAAIRADAGTTVAGCLLLDLHLPGLNGAELQERLRAKGLEIPTILMTGQPHGPQAARARAAGVTEIMPKPIDGTALLTTIHQLLPRPD